MWTEVHTQLNVMIPLLKWKHSEIGKHISLHSCTEGAVKPIFCCFEYIDSIFTPIQHKIVPCTSVVILAVLTALCSLRRVTFFDDKWNWLYLILMGLNSTQLDQAVAHAHCAEWVNVITSPSWGTKGHVSHTCELQKLVFIFMGDTWVWLFIYYL